MIRIKGDGRIGLGSDLDRETLSHRAGKVHFFSDFQLFGSRHLLLFDGQDVVRIRHAVGFLRHQVDILDLSDCHILDRFIEAFDHLTSAAEEFDRISSVIRGIKLGAVVKGTFVVDFDFFVRVAHDDSPFYR